MLIYNFNLKIAEKELDRHRVELDALKGESSRLGDSLEIFAKVSLIRKAFEANQRMQNQNQLKYASQSIFQKFFKRREYYVVTEKDEKLFKSKLAQFSSEFSAVRGLQGLDSQGKLFNEIALQIDNRTKASFGEPSTTEIHLLIGQLEALVALIEKTSEDLSKLPQSQASADLQKQILPWKENYAKPTIDRFKNVLTAEAYSRRLLELNTGFRKLEKVGLSEALKKINPLLADLEQIKATVSQKEEQLPEWLVKNLADRLELTTHALKQLKNTHKIDFELREEKKSRIKNELTQLLKSTDAKQLEKELLKLKENVLQLFLSRNEEEPFTSLVSQAESVLQQIKEKEAVESRKTDLKKWVSTVAAFLNPWIQHVFSKVSA